LAKHFDAANDEKNRKEQNLDKFWEFVKNVDWPSDFSFGRISAEIKEKYSLDFITLMSNVFEELDSQLYKAITKAEEENGKQWTFLGSEDRFSDLRASIIGHGKEAFEEVINDPRLVKKYPNHESFSYIF
jgi:hypothetical protein